MVICPGGGHRNLAIEHEGYDIAKWFNNIGVAGFVLKYRLARAAGSKYKVEEHALEDARRAVRLVRSRASRMGHRPARVGMMGFSAGGEVTALAGTRFELGQRGSRRPDRPAELPSGFPRPRVSRIPPREH